MTKEIDIITLFPQMFSGVFGDSIIKRAVDNKILEIRLTQLRDFAFDKHKQVDDSPFGGGSGMVLKPEPVFRAVRQVLQNSNSTSRRIIITDPAGETFNQKKAKELAQVDWLIFICGHYEGFDARIYTLADELISIGDYVLTGGEIPTMAIVDAVARMLPNVLGAADSAKTDSFFENMLSYPQYTRPRNFEGMEVPEVLLSGNHAEISKWRQMKAFENTMQRRPDLIFGRD
ncbi:MAG: tRNA (guanosine(37)-N1)-methyltransferase TrmD [Selenomonadaceae bacterium]|nr:tRNA (guanosine(37)-N1)-methyltransferase TrmD [Selenomonadaceae bacterium]